MLFFLSRCVTVCIFFPLIFLAKRIVRKIFHFSTNSFVVAFAIVIVACTVWFWFWFVCLCIRLYVYALDLCDYETPIIFTMQTQCLCTRCEKTTIYLPIYNSFFNALAVTMSWLYFFRQHCAFSPLSLFFSIFFSPSFSPRAHCPLRLTLLLFCCDCFFFSSLSLLLITNTWADFDGVKMKPCHNFFTYFSRTRHTNWIIQSLIRDAIRWMTIFQFICRKNCRQWFFKISFQFTPSICLAMLHERLLKKSNRLE